MRYIWLYFHFQEKKVKKEKKGKKKEEKDEQADKENEKEKEKEKEKESEEEKKVRFNSLTSVILNFLLDFTPAPTLIKILHQ